MGFSPFGCPHGPTPCHIPHGTTCSMSKSNQINQIISITASCCLFVSLIPSTITKLMWLPLFPLRHPHKNNSALLSQAFTYYEVPTGELKFSPTTFVSPTTTSIRVSSLQSSSAQSHAQDDLVQSIQRAFHEPLSDRRQQVHLFQ